MGQLSGAQSITFSYKEDLSESYFVFYPGSPGKASGIRNGEHYFVQYSAIILLQLKNGALYSKSCNL